MLKGQSVRLYYTVWSLATGEPVAGDLSSHEHTVYYTSGDEWITMSSIQPEEVGNGVYTFVLPANNTDVDTAVCRIESTNDGVVIPPIHLDFTSISDSDHTLMVNNFLASTIDSDTTLSEAIKAMLSQSSSVYDVVSGLAAKFSSYPSAQNIPTKSDIPTVAQIAAGVLTTDIPSNAGAFSVGAMVLGGFCSDLDPSTNTWTIRNTDTTVLTTKTFVTSSEMGPIVSVR